MYNEFKNKILKKELIRFIVEGLLIIFVLGIMIGFLDIVFLLSKPTSIILYFTSFFFYVFLTRRLKKTFSAYFKIYSVLAVIFVVFGFYVIRIASQFAITLVPGGGIFNYKIFNPLVAFGLYSGWTSFLGILTNVVNLLFYTIISIATYENMKIKM